MASLETTESPSASFSMHGLNHALGSSTRLSRFSWTLFLIGAGIGFSLHMWSLISDYMDAPITLEPKTIVPKKGDKMFFPEIVICPTFRWSQTKMTLYGGAQSDLVVAMKTLKKATNYDWKDMHTMLSTFKNGTAFKKFSHGAEDTIVRCTFMNRPCNESELKEVFMEDYYLCHAFQTSFQLMTNDIFMKPSLELVIYVDDNPDSKYIVEDPVVLGKGVIISATNADSWVPEHNYGFLVPTGSATHIWLKYKETKRLSSKRNCRDNSEVEKRYTVRTTSDKTGKHYFNDPFLCFEYKQQEIYWKMCNCTCRLLPIFSNMDHRRCWDFKFVDNFTKLLNIEEIIADKNCNERAKAVMPWSEIKERCSNFCFSKQFDATSDALMLSNDAYYWQYFHTMLWDRYKSTCSPILKKAFSFPSNMSHYTCKQMKNISSKAEGLLMKPRILKNNLIKVNIALESLNIYLTEEKQTMKGWGFVAEVGGTMGIWLGLGLLGIVEIVEAVFKYFFGIIWFKWRHQRKCQDDKKCISDSMDCESVKNTDL